MLKKNQVIELAITDVSNAGGGVGHYQGMAVFVPMTAIGDLIKAKIVKVLKSHAYAIIHSVITPSAQRVENDCPAYRRCGGCALRHIGYAHELEIKAAWVTESLKRIGGIEIAADQALPSRSDLRYRNKAQYPVRLVDGKICAGFFAERSHALIPVDDCLLQPAFFADVVRAVIGFMEEFLLSAYDEDTNTGLVRHIFIRYAEKTGEAMLCLIINADSLPRADKLAERLNQSCPMITTIVTNTNKRKTNVIFGDKTTVLTGEGYITDELFGIRVRLSARSFYQVNRDAAEQLYKTALGYANPGGTETLLDLYCGTGTIGLSMAHAVREVIGVEVVPQAVADAVQNASRNGIENARFLFGDAFEAAGQLKAEGVKPDIIVLDPPRKGIDDNLPALIAELAPEKLVYISCNPATLARDAKRLTELGYTAAKVAAVDLFPRTPHIESVLLMLKTGGQA